MVLDNDNNNLNCIKYYNNIINNNILLSNTFCNKFNIKRTGINISTLFKKKNNIKKIQKNLK